MSLLSNGQALALFVVWICLTTVCAQQLSCANSSDPQVDAALKQFPLCSHYVSPNEQLFIPPFGFPSQFVQGMYGMVRLLGTKIVGRSESASRSCVDNALRYFCSFLFRPCSPEGLPRAVCQSTCAAVDTDCRKNIAGLFAFRNASSFYPLLLPPCDSLESGNLIDGSTPEVAGQPVFPQSEVRWNTSAGNIIVQCNEVALISPIPNYACYGVWQLETKRNNTPYCHAVCPLPVIKPYLYKYTTRLMLIIGIIDIVMATGALILRSAVPQYRGYPSNLILWILGWGIFGAIQLVWPFFRHGGHHSFVCVGSEPSKRLDIRFEGAFWTMSNVAISNYWAAITVHTLVAVQLSTSYLNRKTEIATICYGVGYPIVLAVIGLASRQMTGYDYTDPYGYYKTAGPTNYYPKAEFILYWVPFGINLLVAVPCIIFVLVTSLRRQAQGNRFHWLRNFRILLFLMVFLFIESWKWGYRIWTLSWQKQKIDELLAYITCTAFQPDCPRGRQIGAETVVFLAFNFIPPTVLAILFGSNSEIRKHWFSSYRHRTNPWTTSTTLSATGTGTGTDLKESVVLTSSITDS